MKKIFLSLSLLLMLGLVWVVAAQETESHDEADNAALIARGREIFTTMGCTACHGTEAQGTDLAPALAGHSEFAVRRQLRAPVGIMPVYSPLMVTSEDVEAVVAYVTNLVPIEATAEATSESMAGMDMGGTAEASHEHGHSGLAKGDISFAHHWLLYLALQAENKDAAIHQIAHIIPLLEGVHLVQMENLLTLVTAGDFAAALPIAESMVVDVNVFGEDADLVYLQMIYRALLAEDAENSVHFITDYLEHGVNHDYMHLVETAQPLLAAGDFEGAAAVLAGEHGEHLLFEADSHEHGAEATAEAGHDAHGAEATEEAHTGN